MIRTYNTAVQGNATSATHSITLDGPGTYRLQFHFTPVAQGQVYNGRLLPWGLPAYLGAGVTLDTVGTGAQQCPSAVLTMRWQGSTQYIVDKTNVGVIPFYDGIVVTHDTNNGPRQIDFEWDIYYIPTAGNIAVVSTRLSP